VRGSLRNGAPDLRRGAGGPGPRGARPHPGGQRRSGLHGRAGPAGSRGGPPPRDGDRADDRRRRWPAGAGRRGRLRCLAGISQDDAGRDARRPGYRSSSGATTSFRLGRTGKRSGAASPWLGLPGLPPEGW
jgi:hypothetical protein